MAEKKRGYTEAQKRASVKWEAANVYKATVKLPKDWERLVRERAEQVGGSVNAYLKTLVEDDLFNNEPVEEPTRETFEDAP